MADPASPSGSDYLTKLFAQKAPVPFFDPGMELIQEDNPAMAARSIPDLLSKINFAFLTPYLTQGYTNMMFGKPDNDDTFTYNYECPDLQSAVESSEAEKSDPEETLDEDELAAPENPYLNENIEFDLGVPGLSIGLLIAFNDNTGLYQLDWAYVQTGQQEPIEISCAQENKKDLMAFLIAFSALAKKIIDHQPVSKADKSILYKLANHAAGQEKGPEPA